MMILYTPEQNNKKEIDDLVKSVHIDYMQKGRSEEQQNDLHY